MYPDTRRQSASVRTELNVALGLSAAWLIGSLTLFVLLPGGNWGTSPQGFNSADMWGVRLPNLSTPIPLDADVPGVPHEYHEDDHDDHSYAHYLPKFAEGAENLLASRIPNSAAPHTSGRPAFSSDGTFLGTVCCLEKRTTDGFGLQLTKGNSRYSLNIPASRVGFRGSAIEIGMTLQDVNQAARTASPHC